MTPWLLALLVGLPVARAQVPAAVAVGASAVGASAVGAPAGAAPAVAAQAAGALALDRHPERLVSVTLPPQARADAVGDVVEVGGPWVLLGTVDGVRTWQTPLPVRPRTLFFHRSPEGMALLQHQEGKDWDHARTITHRRGIEDSARRDTWEFTNTALRVRRKIEDGPPAAGEYAVRYDAAVERERALQRDAFVGDDAAYLMRGLQLDDTTRHGLLLPAPAQATFQVDVPTGAVLDLEPGILPPEASPSGRHSDGATLVVTVDGQDVASFPLVVGQFASRRVDLGTYGGRSVALGLRVDPGASADLDYAFVASPILHVPLAHPPRVVILFVDTLRRDALSMYGYERPTTPRLDAWAAGGAIFDQARSTAPWTLPSTRTLFLGTQPERWGQVPTLQERAADAGWATAFIAGNVYLSSNFDMDRGWGTHRCINWPSADIEVRRANDWLDSVSDRPALLVLQLMDMHLPYTEPTSYRDLFAGQAPEGLRGDFDRSGVLSAVKRDGAPARQYVRDRYDDSLRFVDDQLSDFMAGLDPQDVVVLMADHGEEFWDHDGFEHGHTLYDELLRVPLVLHGPGITPGRVGDPVSLMDVAPTLAQAMGLDTTGMTGIPLQGVVEGSQAARFDARPLGFGRPLYGDRAWGVVDQGLKYTSSQGAEHIHDMAVDPGETAARDQGGKRDAAPLLQAMARGLERPVVTALRVLPSKSTSADELVVTVRDPGGIADAWAAEDPLSQAEVTVTRPSPEVAVLTWAGGARGTREAYILPARPLDQALPELELEVRHQSEPQPLARVRPESWPPAYTGVPALLFRGRATGRTVSVDYARVPVPDVDAAALVGVNAELHQDLKALGYIDE